MIKKSLPFVIALSISFLTFQTPVRVPAQTGKEAPLAEKIKADVTAIGVGARVSIQLHDKGKLIGYISQIDEKAFVVTKAKEGAKQTVAFADATEVKVKNE